MGKVRLLAAIIGASLSVATLYFVLGYFFSGYVDAGKGHLEKLLWESFFGIFFMVLFFSLVLGFPIVLVLVKINRLSMVNCIWISFLLGFLVGFGVSSYFSGPEGYQQPFVATLVFSCMAGIGAAIEGAIFSLIARLPRTTAR